MNRRRTIPIVIFSGFLLSSCLTEYQLVGYEIDPNIEPGFYELDESAIVWIKEDSYGLYAVFYTPRDESGWFLQPKFTLLGEVPMVQLRQTHKFGSAEHIRNDDGEPEFFTFAFSTKDRRITLLNPDLSEIEAKNELDFVWRVQSKLRDMSAFREEIDDNVFFQSKTILTRIDSDTDDRAKKLNALLTGWGAETLNKIRVNMSNIEGWEYNPDAPTIEELPTYLAQKKQERKEKRRQELLTTIVEMVINSAAKSSQSRQAAMHQSNYRPGPKDLWCETEQWKKKWGPAPYQEELYYRTFCWNQNGGYEGEFGPMTGLLVGYSCFEVSGWCKHGGN